MILAAYILLTLVFTYPLVLHLGTHMQGAGDGFYFLWELWWFSRSLWSGGTPLHNDTLFYPSRDVRMVWATASNELLAWPMEPLLGPVRTYNVLTIVNIALSGYTMYLLMRYLTKNRWAAFAAGFIFTFSPFHFVNAYKGLLNITTWQWLPLCALAGLRLIDQRDTRRVLYFALALTLVSLSDSYIFVYFTILFVPGYLLYLLATGNRPLIPLACVSFLVSAALSVPFLLPYVSLAGVSAHMKIASYDVGWYSQHLLRYLIPYRFHPVWGRYFAWFYPDPFFEASCFTGYIPLILGAVAMYLPIRRDMKMFWGAMGTAAAVFSLGPYLHVWHLVNIGSSPVPMPYLILQKLPFFPDLRIPARFSIVLILSLAVLSGLVLARMRGGMTIFFIVIAVGFEYILFCPYPLTRADVPGFYTQIRGNPAVKAILEIPSGQIDPFYIWNMNKYMYYQTYHHKPMVSGHLPRVPDGLEEFTQDTPFLRDVTQPETLLKGDIIPVDLAEEAREGIKTLRRFSIDPIILHKDAEDALSAPQYGALERYLTESLGPPYYQDTEVLAFHPPEPREYRKGVEQHGPRYILGPGWYPPHYRGSQVHRLMRGEANVIVDVPRGTYRLMFRFVRPLEHSRTLDVFLGEHKLETFDISSVTLGKENIYYTGKITITGRTKIVFKVEEGAVRPVDIVSTSAALEMPMALPIALDFLGIRLISR